jgi:dolichyl-diphosphooligosaccharide--protein glycosyltransferase
MSFMLRVAIKSIMPRVMASRNNFFKTFDNRSVAGSYDNEGIAIFCMLFTYYLWIKSVKTGAIYWSTLCALAYFYMVSHLPGTWNHIQNT